MTNEPGRDHLARYGPLFLRQVSAGRPFDLAAILDGTQDFRWHLTHDDWYSGVLDGHFIHLRQVGDVLEYQAEEDVANLLRRYFRLDDDFDAARAELASVDGRMRELVGRYPNLRVLRQPDPWECMVAYICSANNSVARIGGIVEMIARRLGRPVSLGSEVRHTFPSPVAVLEAGEKTLATMRLGLDRHVRIVAAARRICQGALDLQHLAQSHVPYVQARRELMSCDGVGSKLADCICLFALDKPEAFPLDRWIRRACGAYFLSEERPGDAELVRWAQHHFGSNAGLASQLLFRSTRPPNVGLQPITAA